MPQINILPKHIAELIAAGEVVERPASIVKEIMENAIDAGADKITLEIKRGGITYIRITDNGCGIDRDNIRKAFISHATSKISTADDLNAICTLGFRGEALASIAAVSRVEVMTRGENEDVGTRYCIEGGEETVLDDAGCPKGTTLIVRDLFYNTPARMKFLKKDVSEGNAVAAVVDRIALSHPEVSVRFIRDSKDVLFTSGDGRLDGAIYKVLGKDFASTLIPCDYELEGVRVSGYISKPFNARPNRMMQYFFLNDRFIKTRTGMVALEEAYKNSVMVGKFPACVLKIQIAPGAVDVNVHPAKTEVRFANEKMIFNAVYYCAKSALQQGDTRVQATFQQKVSRQFMPRPAEGKQIKIYGQQLEQIKKEARPEQDFWANTTSDEFRKTVETPKSEPIVFNDNNSKFEIEKNETPDLISGFKPTAREAAPIEQTKPEPVESKPSIESEPVQPIVEEVQPEVEPYRVIGEAFKTYMLLAPVTVTLSKEEYSAVLDNLDLLEKAGYHVEDFGGGMVIVNECPTAVADADLAEVIMELAGHLVTGQKELVPEKLDWIYHSTACRAAIKAGDRTTDYELNRFVESLLNNPDIRYCPHGRPVLVEMSRYEIEKNFGRV